MRRTEAPRRHASAGAATGDVLIVLSALSLVAALVYPVVANRQRSTYWDRVAGEVTAVQNAAEGYYTQNGSWPLLDSLGGPPAELLRRLPEDVALETEAYSIRWEPWEVVHVPEPDTTAVPEEPVLLPEDEAAADSIAPVVPPPAIQTVGSISVSSADLSLLAALLDRFGWSRSFVRDSTWTLVIPRRGRPILR